MSGTGEPAHAATLAALVERMLREFGELGEYQRAEFYRTALRAITDPDEPVVANSEWTQELRRLLTDLGVWPKGRTS